VNCNGSAINYTFFEADVDGYKSEVTNSTLYNWTIINTHVPELTEVNVTKVWIDFNDTDGIRPVSVTVMLYANGKNIRNDTLNKSNDWKLTFKDLDKYENGVLINYTIKELAVEGYNTTIHNNTYEFTIVNSHIRPNMTVEKISLNKTVLRGDNTEFIIVVTNTGNCNLTNVKVTEIFNDNELRYINHTNKESWTKSGNVFNYIHALEPNASANFTITFKTLVNGTLINKVNASSNETDNKTGNNTTDVKPVCDLEITKLVNASEVFVNDMVEWSIIVKNNGPNTAENVIVRDTLPDNVEFSVPENCKVEGNTLIWNIGEVRPNESVSLVIVTKLLAEGQFDNFVSVNTTTNESDYTDNEANNTTVANPICDLIINKTVNASSIDVGDSVEWTISVINAGPSTARDVKVKDTLPAGALILSANPSAGSFDKDTRVWEIGSLAANEPVSLILVTQILTEGDITNVAVVNTSTYEPNRTNNEANNTTIANPICDLEIVKLVNASCVYENELVEWTVSVENKGPCVAHDVIVTDALPEGLKLIDSTPSVGTYSNGIWTIGTLEKDATVSLVLITKAAIAGNITNIASVNSTTPDRNTSNNVANNTTEVIPVCDLEIAKLVSSSDVNITDFVEWTIRVANKGPSTAKDVTVTENLPDGLKLINATPSVGSYADGIWTIGDLEKDQVVYLVLETQVVKDGRITNIVVVNSTTPDKNTTNNKANNTTNVKPVCDLEIIKLVSAKKAYVGEELTWTIKVINHGPSAASDVKVSEDIPDSLRFINAIATKGKYNADTQVWTIGKLASGSSETLQIVTKVLSVGNITNPVEVTTSTPDSNKTNNRANNTTEGIPIVDLAVFKYADKEAYHVGDKIEWQITVINYGPCDAHGVVASDVLPDGVKFISFKASKGSYDSSTGRWDIGNLTDGESATLYIYCVALVEGMITNEVNVTCNETDSNPSNNFDNCTVEVIKNETEPPVHPEKPPVTMKETGNPLAYLVMALVVIFGSLWSENRKE
ncbi:Cna B-type domain-containing protein, partial [Methanobrevibacter sp.]|uniref:Cna B-type domain-containing protein n=1 Tax=Methanobrevibacter sp. TaxID=66852 RepID=UPI00386FBE4B